MDREGTLFVRACLYDITVWELGSDVPSSLSRLCEQCYLQTNVCVKLKVSALQCAADMYKPSFTSIHSHVNTSNLLWEHYCFLPYTFPLIPPATDVGLNYHQSIWLLIIQRMKKSWPSCQRYRRPRANSTECVTCFANHWSVLRTHTSPALHANNTGIHSQHWCDTCVHLCAYYLYLHATRRKPVGSAQLNKKNCTVQEQSRKFVWTWKLISRFYGDIPTNIRQPNRQTKQRRLQTVPCK